MKTLRALKTMVHDAVDATVELVREGNESAARSVRRAANEVPGLGGVVGGVDDVRRVATSGVLGSIRAINHVVEFASDVALDRVAARRAADDEAHERQGSVRMPVRLSADVAGEGAWFADTARGVLNAVVGDYLDVSENTLGIAMQLRVEDVYLDMADRDEVWREALSGCEAHVIVWVHGLGATEWSWFLGSQTYYGAPEANIGSKLAAALDASTLYVRYNTGRSIEQNGDACAALLEQFMRNAPAHVKRLTLIGHSMGGLVLRHACHVAQSRSLVWGTHVRDIFYLGSPHQGAPLAAFGEALTTRLGDIDLPATRIISRILSGRSVGTKELAEGMTRARRVQLPLGEAVHHFVLGTITADEHGASSFLLGDLLVRRGSASGSEARASKINKKIKHHGGLLHHHLQNHPAVYAHIVEALGGER